MVRTHVALWAIVLGTAIIGSAAFSPLTHAGVVYALGSPHSGYALGSPHARGVLQKPGVALRWQGARVPPAVRRMKSGPRMHAEVLSAAGAVLPRIWLTALGTVSTDQLSQFFFVASNVGYLIAGAAILLHTKRDKLALGMSLLLTGLVSATFHGHQCILSSTHNAVHALCWVDITFAFSTAFIYILSCGSAVFNGGPSRSQIGGWILAAACFSHGGVYYTTTHALWHLVTAWLAYDAVLQRDEGVSLARHSARTLDRTVESLRPAVEGVWTTSEGTWRQIRESLLREQQPGRGDPVSRSVLTQMKLTRRSVARAWRK